MEQAGSSDMTATQVWCWDNKPRTGRNTQNRMVPRDPRNLTKQTSWFIICCTFPGSGQGIEAGFATQFAYTLSDRRVLELYLNYAQFGPKLFGVCAATWYYFNTPPWSMTPEQAAVLMGVVPFPSLIQRGPEGGAYVDKEKYPKTWDNLNGAANVWVPRQLEGMGGWQAAVATVGITDEASHHADKRDSQDSCSTMPDAVRARLMNEGYLQ